MNLKCPLRNSADIDNAVDYLNSTVQQAVWNSTALRKTNDTRRLSRKVKERKEIKKERFVKYCKPLVYASGDRRPKCSKILAKSASPSPAHSSSLKMNNGCWAKADFEIAVEFSRHLAEVFSHIQGKHQSAKTATLLQKQMNRLINNVPPKLVQSGNQKCSKKFRT